MVCLIFRFAITLEHKGLKKQKVSLVSVRPLMGNSEQSIQKRGVW